MRKITSIIICCSDSDVETPYGRSIVAADITRWHRSRGFGCVGYHFVIDYDGTVEPGRPLDMPGAYCTGFNRSSIGVCYVGGRRGVVSCDTRTDSQKDSIVLLLRSLVDMYPSVSSIVGLNELNNRVYSPCFDVRKEYESFIVDLFNPLYHEKTFVSSRELPSPPSRCQLLRSY